MKNRLTSIGVASLLVIGGILGTLDINTSSDGTLSNGNVGDWPMFSHDLNHTGYSSLIGNMSQAIKRWDYYTGAKVWSSPAIADINNDGKSEVVCGSNNGKVYALNAEDGSYLWDYFIGPYDAVKYVHSSPTVADLDDDGIAEVVIGSYGNYTHALNGEDGSPLWHFGNTGEIFSTSPAVYDIDFDGKPEVVIGSRRCMVYALNGEDGSELWNFNAGQPVYSSPAIADIDDDGKVEIVFGCNDCKIYALNGEDGSYLWDYKTATDVIFSSPAIADIDEDGKPEVVVASLGGLPADHRLYALNAEDGSYLWDYPVYAVHNSPAIADIDLDGKLEVVVGSYDNGIHAVNGEDGSVLWRSFTNNFIFSSPAIGDIDNDGKPEVIIGSRDCYLHAVNGEDGWKLWKYATGGWVESSPALGDIDNDGWLEIVLGSEDGNIYALDTPLEYPDYIPSDVVSAKAEYVLPGSYNQISARVLNVGNSTTLKSTIAFYNSTTPTAPFYENADVPGLGVGEKSSIYTATWIAPKTFGIYYVNIEVDYNDAILEYNESNNIRTIKFVVGGPDYVLRNTFPWYKYKMPAGEIAVISTQIKNVGNLNATCESTIAFYNQTGPSPFTTYMVSPLNVSEVSKKYNANWRAPRTQGTYQVVIEVDYYNVIEELNETNNTYMVEFEVYEILPPTNLTTNVSGTDDIQLDWVPPPSSYLVHYLIYGAEDQRDFDFKTPIHNTSLDTNPLRTNWTDKNGISRAKEYYYVVRAVYMIDSNISISSTSNTAGIWSKNFPRGISTFSLPLEPFVRQDVEFYCQDMNASFIKWMNLTTKTWMRHEKGDSGNNTFLEIGKGYEVKFNTETNYTFTGMPGAMISYDDDNGFLGFDSNSEAKNLTVIVEPNGDVNLSWQEPASMSVGDWYEVYYSNMRDGFFGILDSHYFPVCPPVKFGNNTVTHQGAQANNPNARLYYMVVPFNVSGVRGASTYSIGIWTEEYLSQYDTFGIPLKLSSNHTADWYCDNILDTVGINYYNISAQRWSWHSTRMSEGAYDPIMVMAEGYQVSTSSATKFTFIGV